MPDGERPFRTTVDFMGIGEHVEGYNGHLGQIMTGLYTNFGIEGLLTARKESDVPAGTDN